MKSSKRIIIAGSVLYALIAGCTSQIDSTTDPVVTDNTPNAGGIYTGTITQGISGPSSDVVAIFDSKQRFAIYSKDLTSLYIGLYNVIGSNVSGTATAYALNSGAFTGRAKLNTSFVAKSEISGGYDFYLPSNMSTTPDGTGQIDLPTYKQLTYETPSATKTVEGTWDNHDSSGFPTISFKIIGDGTVTTGTTPNCNYTGSIGTINLMYNVYKVSLSESCTGSAISQTLIGLGSIFPADSDNPTARLVLAVGSSTEGRLFVLKPALTD